MHVRMMYEHPYNKGTQASLAFYYATKTMAGCLMWVDSHPLGKYCGIIIKIRICLYMR